MNLSIGLWPSKWSFNKFIFKYQYEGTDLWKQSFPLLNRIIDIKSMSDIDVQYTGDTVSPCDMDVDLPYTVRAIIKNGRAELSVDDRDELKKYTLYKDEIDAGSCPLCRISGYNHMSGRAIAVRAMFVLNRNGVPIKRLVGGKMTNVVGAWMPCICVPKKDMVEL